MKQEHPIYLDNHATTRVDPRVLESMLPFFDEEFGNAASAQHEFGWRAASAVKHAREQIASLLNADADEIVFTSGATESINLALKGVAESYRSRGNHLITAATEHKATLDSCIRLTRYGYEVTVLPVDGCGQISLDELQHEIRRETILVLIMTANNEIGTIAHLEAIGTICRERQVLFHTDAAQGAGKTPIDVRRMNIDLLSLTSHKMYGPKGVGALFVRGTGRTLTLMPQIDGGGHERGLRSGTLNVPGIVGFGKAAEICTNEMTDENGRVGNLRERLVNGITTALGDVTVNGDPAQRLAGNANLRITGIQADRLITELKDIAFSTGSACSSANPKPSHVLKAIGLTDEQARSSVRFGVGRFNTAHEIELAVGRTIEAVRKLRQLSSIYRTAVA